MHSLCLSRNPMQGLQLVNSSYKYNVLASAYRSFAQHRGLPQHCRRLLPPCHSLKHQVRHSQHRSWDAIAACLPRPLASLHRLQRPARILSQCTPCLGEGLKIVHKMQSPQHDYAPVNQTLNVIQPPLCQPARELPETVRVFRLLCSESVRNPA